MTDNDIRNAIAGCVNSTVKCNECVFIDELYDGSGLCMVVALRYALDIINRQKEEIESLQAEVDNVNHDYILLCSDVAENRSEAIKEFAERLKSVVAIHNGDMWSKYEYIDNLVKEMVGDKND